MRSVQEADMEVQRQKEPLVGRRYCRFKRLQDIVLSFVALVVLWPFLLLVALIIVIDSPGASPLFCQTRIGRDGKAFTFYKFRSMRPNAEGELESLLKFNEMQGPTFKIREDPRITRFGKFIRKTSIDELPQLWNVLRGEMSMHVQKTVGAMIRYRISVCM